MKNNIRLLVKILISILLICWVLSRLDMTRIFTLLSGVHGVYVLIALVLFLLNALSIAYKWNLLILAQDIKISLKRIFINYMVGIFFNSFIMGMGEIKRIWDLTKDVGEEEKATASVFAEKWTGTVCQVLVAEITLIICCFQSPQDFIYILFVNTALLVFLLGIFFMAGHVSPIPFTDRFPAVHNWLENFRKAHNIYLKKPRYIIFALLLSLITPLLFILIHYLLTLGLGIKGVPLMAFILYMPAITVFSQLPITFNGIGVQDILFVLLFKHINLEQTSAVAISLLSHLVKAVMGVLGGIIYLLKPRGKFVNPEDPGGNE